MDSKKCATRLLGLFRRRSGQVEVETAIVMPAVVFLLLGLLQLGMLHQARIIAEYAAYRAVRHGVVKNASVDEMEKAALGAAMPILSRPSGYVSGPEILQPTDTAMRWMGKWMLPGFGGTFPVNKMVDSMGQIQYTEVAICGPLKGDVNGSTYTGEDGKKYVPFDDPSIAGSGLKTKLRIELTLNYRMVIPFADWVIFNMAKGHNVVKELRLQSNQSWTPALLSKLSGDKYDKFSAMMGVHVLPIRAQYSMKMHSDIPIDNLPDQNDCIGGKGGS